MRILNAERNTLVIKDNTTGTDLEVYYRMPTTQERMNYAAETMKRKGSKIFMLKNSLPQQIKYGKLLITGFRKGDFGLPDGKPFSSDPAETADYKSDWKDLLEKRRLRGRARPRGQDGL